MRDQAEHPVDDASTALSRRRAIGLIGAAAAAGGTILTPARAQARRPIKRFLPPPIGAKWVFDLGEGRTENYERVENGSWLTNPTVRYRWETEGADPLLRSFNPMNGNWLVSHVPDGDPIFAADPDDRRYRWPLSEIGFWRSEFTVRNLRDQTSYKRLAVWKVDGKQSLRTPMGWVRTVRLSYIGEGPVQKVWYALSLGVRVRTQTFEGNKLIAEKNLVSYTVT